MSYDNLDDLKVCFFLLNQLSILVMFIAKLMALAILLLDVLEFQDGSCLDSHCFNNKNKD